jgi:hypothetical protein
MAPFIYVGCKTPFKEFSIANSAISLLKNLWGWKSLQNENTLLAYSLLHMETQVDKLSGP